MSYNSNHARPPANTSTPSQLAHSAKTYLVSFKLSQPAGQLPLLRYGLRSVASDYADIDRNLVMVRSRRSAETIANALMPALSSRDALRVMEVGEDIAAHNGPVAWRSLL